MGKITMTVESTLPCKCAHKQDCPKAVCKCVVTGNKQQDCCPQVEPREITLEVVRGGVVRAWVTWEAYLGDIVHKVFQVVIKSATSDVKPTDQHTTTNVAILEALEKKWSNIRTMIQLQFEAGLGEGEPKKAAATLFDILKGKVTWQKLLDEHVDKAVDAMSPVFDPRGSGIDKTFQKLFCSKQNFFDQPVSNRIVNLAGHVFRFKYLYCAKGKTESETESFDVEIKCGTTLCDILRLYYGLRCAFTHGSVEKTLNNGVLTNFPWNPIQLIVKQGSKVCESAVVQDSLMELYKKIENQKTEVQVTLNDLKNMVSFLKQCASHLTVIMNNWLVKEMKIKD